MAKFWRLGRGNLKLSTKAMILVAVPLCFELLFVGGLSGLLYQLEVERAREAHARDLAGHMSNLMRLLLQRTTANVLNHLMNNDESRERLHKTNVSIKEELDLLPRLTEQQPQEHAVIDQIEAIVRKNEGDFYEAKEMMDRGERLSAAISALKVQKGLGQLFDLADNLVDEQQAIEKEKSALLDRYRRTVPVVLAVGITFNVLLALILAIYFNRGTGSRLKMLMENINRLASERPLLPPLSGGDEIAELDRFFRAMSDSLQAIRRKERAILENALAIICSFDESGRFTQMNPACESVWGWKPEELLGRQLAEIVDEDERERLAHTIERTRQDGSTAAVEFRIQRRDGSISDTQWAMHWSPIEQSIFCVAQDVSDRKELERMKREFVAMVSHDLKTPLTSIQMVHSLLEAGAYGEINESGRESLALAERDTDRLIRMVSELIEMEKIESGGLKLELAPVSTKSVFDSSLASVRGFAELQKVNLKSELPADYMIEADFDKLVQVVVNLLSNAIKFSQPDSCVSLIAEESDSLVKFKVHDTGRGIPAHLQEAIFDRFKQVSKDDARLKGGSGLGLAICKAIVERHGGTIGVESEEGKGSTFWFCIPKSRATAIKITDASRVERN